VANSRTTLRNPIIPYDFHDLQSLGHDAEFRQTASCGRADGIATTTRMSSDIATLISDLSQADPKRRYEAAKSLSQLGEAAREAATALTVAAGDESEDVREWAISALEEIGPPDVRDCKKLAALLSHSTVDVAYWAATLLGRLAEQAAPAIPELSKALTSTADVAVRQRIATALGKIGPGAKASLPALQQAVLSDDPRLTRLATRAIQQITGG
jgi:HEAT repeat protein